MPHIHTEPGQHDHTASAYLFRTDSGEPKVLLHIHKKFGTYMQFGGHIELHENPWQAVTHELREESGYEMSQLQLLQPKQRIKAITDATLHPQPVSHSTHQVTADHYHTDSAYILTTSELPKHLPEEGESTDIQAFTRAELIALPSEKIYDNVREIALYCFDECLSDWEATSTAEFAA